MKHWLIRLYPQAWRKRYGEEFAALLEQHPFTWCDAIDLLWNALDAHWTGRALYQQKESMMDNKRLRMILLFAIWVALFVRSMLNAEFVWHGVALVALTGLACLITILMRAVVRYKDGRRVGE